MWTQGENVKICTDSNPSSITESVTLEDDDDVYYYY